MYLIKPYLWYMHLEVIKRKENYFLSILNCYEKHYKKL